MPLIKYPEVEKFHPIVLKLCKNIPQYLALMDTTIHVDHIKKASNNLFRGSDIPKLFTNNSKIILEPKGRELMSVVEAAQINSLHHLTKQNVVVGDTKKMRLRFPTQDFPSMQANQDASLNFDQSTYQFQNGIGIDWKYIMGKTVFSGRNQVSVGSTMAYEIILEQYFHNLTRKHNVPNITAILEKAKALAIQNNWPGQLDHWAENLHKFPKNWSYSLHMHRNMPLQSFNEPFKLQIIREKKRFRLLSKMAYEKNIPEDHFSESHVAQLLAELPDDSALDALPDNSWDFVD